MEPIAPKPTTQLALFTQVVKVLKHAIRLLATHKGDARPTPALHHLLAQIKIFVCLAALILLVLGITAHRAIVQFVATTLTANKTKLVQSRIAHREAARLLFALHGHHHQLAPARTFAMKLVMPQAVELVALRMNVKFVPATPSVPRAKCAPKLLATDKDARQYHAQ